MLWNALNFDLVHPARDREYHFTDSLLQLDCKVIEDRHGDKGNAQ